MTTATPLPRRPVAPRRAGPPGPQPGPTPSPRPGSTPDPARPGIAGARVARNFLSMGAAEVACRGTSILVTLALARVCGLGGYGRIEFAFTVVFWLVLLVRNGSEVIAARELARHPRLVRPLVNQVLAIKVLVAAPVCLVLSAVGCLAVADPLDRALLLFYGLLLVTTALGIDFVYRGVERMGLLAVSLYLRTAIFAVGVVATVTDATRIAAVPVWLAVGEVVGIALVWARYVGESGWPRPNLSRRFAAVFAARCRPVLLIQVAQTVLGSVDLMVVGCLCSWEEVGLYGAPHRLIAAVLTLGMIFQQVSLPMLARSWRDSPAAGQRSLDALVRALALGMVPVVAGTVALADPLVAAIFSAEYHGAGWLLALGIGRTYVLTLAFLYQTALIALDREATGVGLLTLGAVGSGPLVAALLWGFGLPGAAVALGLVALVLVALGYLGLARLGRQPSWHHHLGRPILASLAMVPACRALLPIHLGAAVLGGAAVYLAVLAGLGGLGRADLKALRGQP